MKRFFSFFGSLKRDAVIESGKLVFSLIGVGTVLANIATAGILFFAPAVAIFFGAWYAIYLQMEGI
jgi:hypothetical protein